MESFVNLEHDAPNELDVVVRDIASALKVDLRAPSQSRFSPADVERFTRTIQTRKNQGRDVGAQLVLLGMRLRSGGLEVAAQQFFQLARSTLPQSASEAPKDIEVIRAAAQRLRGPTKTSAALQRPGARIGVRAGSERGSL
jgi:hypothetical protein